MKNSFLMSSRSPHETILIIDFGCQYTQLIARRVREQGVFSEIIAWSACSKSAVDTIKPLGIIISGSAESVVLDNHPTVAKFLFNAGIPVLGVCYGMQLMASQLGGKVITTGKQEFGSAFVHLTEASKKSPLFRWRQGEQENKWHVWMSHGDQVAEVPEGFVNYGSTATCPIAAFGDDQRRLYGLQFHVEVTETQHGSEFLRNFLTLCDCKFLWKPNEILSSLIEEARAQIQAESEDGDVVLALSGGVDSSVVAAILHRAIGRRLKCVLVDNGLLRKDEASNVKQAFESSGLSTLDVTVVDATDKFMKALEGVADPEAKRNIIGRTFIEVFETTSKQFKKVKMLAQGTIYPDVIESAGSGCSRLIKSHHNVGGLPETMQFALIEPIRNLFKDEVRTVGELLGLPHHFLWRHPFPGPGLGVRMIGAINAKRAAKLREADAIFIEELRAENLYYKVSQAFAALLSCKSVGVKADARIYDEVIALRAICTIDFMTARVADIPMSVIQRVARRICNEVPGVSRVAYDVTDKPPATIEWE